MVKGKKHKAQNKRGTKKGDKIHGKKKGKKGEAAAYVTRAQALSKLQVSLADFRRLCILKGIYPRDPKKKNSGLDKTYYHTKDITFLTHEPLLNKFFELKTFMKKFKKAMGRNEIRDAKGLEQRKPKYTLSHLVRERYPSFEDAVRDLDDAVSMVALFSSLSAEHSREIPVEAINEAVSLYQEFQLFVIRSQSLRNVFASVKGYYFQVELRGSLVTWLSPHQFAQELPPEVDFRVMVTFLEFYRAMIKFVNFRLYADIGLSYPPKRNESRDAACAEVAALEVQMKEAAEARVAPDTAEDAVDIAEEFGESDEAKELKRRAESSEKLKKVFRGLRVYINREVPLRPVYFTLLCGGATEVGWERGCSSGSSGSAFGVEHEGITHHVADRPMEQIKQVPGREYVQPQWVFDSFNTRILMPIAPYAPGRTPPPHLSPFVDDKAEGYVPRQREILDQLAKDASGAGPAETGASNPEGGNKVVVAQSNFEKFSEELRAEAQGVWHAEYQQGARAEASKDDGNDAVVELPAVAPAPTEEEEEKLRAKALMSKKHKRLLSRIEYTKKTKSDAVESLEKKRKQLQTS